MTDAMRTVLTRMLTDVDNASPEELSALEAQAEQVLHAIRKERRRRILCSYKEGKTKYLLVMKLEKFAQPHGGLKRSDLWDALKVMPVGTMIHVDWIDSNIRSGISICEVLLGMGFSTKTVEDGHVIMRIG